MINKFKSLFAIIICCTLLLVPIKQINAIEQSATMTGNSVQIPNGLDNILNIYFDSRQSTNPQTISESLYEIVIYEMIEDEINRAEKLSDSNINSITNEYTILNCSWGDYIGEISVSESVTYHKTFPVSRIVLHDICFAIEDDGTMCIVSDSYSEDYISFKSVSYIPLSARLSAQSINISSSSIQSNSDSAVNTHTNIGDQAYDLVEVARTQLGYIEKASNSQLEYKTANAGTANYTQYGLWYGYGNVTYVNNSWCAIFVSWCANQAEISRSIIEKERKVKSMYENFDELGLLHLSHARGGTYVPKYGDIVFFRSNGSDYQHVAIVTGVSYSEGEQIVNYIEGNSAQHNVRESQKNLSSTEISAFASPAYSTQENEHNYVSASHNVSTVHTCSYCQKEAVGILECTHSDTFTQSCNLCDYSRTGIWIHLNDDNTGHVCSVCDEYANGSWHGDHTGDPGHICTLCGYESQTLIADPVYDHDHMQHWDTCHICNDTWNYVSHSWEQVLGGYACIECDRFEAYGLYSIADYYDDHYDIK